MGVWFFIVDALANWDNLFTIFYIAIFIVAADEIELTLYYPVVILLMNVICQGGLNMLADLKIKQACRAVNMRTVQKFMVQ